MAEEKPIIAWVGASCKWCGWTGRVEVKEKDAKGKLVVRCQECKERIDVG